MLRDRVAKDIFVFTSEMYAQVTAGIVLTSEGAIVIDALPFPQETRELAGFARRANPKGVRYVINTHFHADHTYGNYLFPEADVVAHERCRLALQKYGEKALEEAKAHTPELAEVQLRLPSITFNEEASLHLGDKTLQLIPTPGHTSDSIVVYLKEAKVLFAGDTIMPVPYLVWGDREEMIKSLQKIRKLSLNLVIQGHGEFLLRGEIGQAIDTSIAYLEVIYEKVKEAIAAGASRDEVRQISIESCGKSRIPLNGLVQQLHEANLIVLYNKLTAETGQR